MTIGIFCNGFGGTADWTAAGLLTVSLTIKLEARTLVTRASGSIVMDGIVAMPATEVLFWGIVAKERDRRKQRSEVKGKNLKRLNTPLANVLLVILSFVQQYIAFQTQFLRSNCVE
jgi:hypothetical protein